MPEDQHAPGATRSRRGLITGVAAAAAIALIVGLAVFQPWKLVVDEVVDEAAPAAVSAPPSSAPPASSAATTSGAPATGSSASPSAQSPEGPRVIARGELISH